MLMKKGSLVIIPTFLTDFDSVNACSVVHYVLLLNAKVKKDPIKLQASIVDET